MTAKIDAFLAVLARRYPLIVGIFTHQGDKARLTAAIGFVAIYFGVLAHAYFTSTNLVTIHGPVFGGDFIAFWTAAKDAFSNNYIALYQPEMFEQRLGELFPSDDAHRLSWQYPPTMTLLIAPFGALPYLASYGAWAIISTGIFVFVLSRFWTDRTALFYAVFSLAAFQGWITGQTGFFTAALLALAAGFADRRPIVAGLAAGLLTVKPQLGLLIPIAFIAAGCWRAFAAAAITSMALAGVSVLVFGMDAWVAFFEAVTGHGERMQTAVFPVYKVISPFGGMAMAGVPQSAALAIHGVFAMALAVFVFAVWRRIKDWDLRLMALCAAAPLATPYAFYYELAVFIPPIFLVARRALETGWLRGEKPALMVLWIAPLLLPGAPQGLPLSFLIAATAFFVCVRRPYGALMNTLPAKAPLATTPA